LPRDLGVQGRRKDVCLVSARPDSLRVSLKCEPRLAQALRGAHAAVLPGYHLDKRHWNTVILDGSLPTTPSAT
jgi:predicted DNA-binding protein (MmcQ/YjbR family)